ncbi:MAG: hypothetical protein ABI747_01445, partial [Candidatus Moraniibacteriota bacterium]
TFRRRRATLASRSAGEYLAHPQTATGIDRHCDTDRRVGRAGEVRVMPGAGHQRVLYRADGGAEADVLAGGVPTVVDGGLGAARVAELAGCGELTSPGRYRAIMLLTLLDLIVIALTLHEYRYKKKNQFIGGEKGLMA